MAKQVSAIRFVGTMGNLVGSKGLDGKVILREKAASVHNPQTVDQMNQRAKFKLATKVAAMLGEVGKLALKANGENINRRGKLTRDLLDKITLVGEQQAGLPRQLNLVKNPMAVSLPQDITASVSAANSVITGTLANVPYGTLTAKALLVYNRNTGEWLQVSSLDTERELSISVDTVSDYDVYFYAEMVLPTTANGKARLENLIGENPGYTVSVARLDTSNFGYSRTLNAGIVNNTSYSDTIAATPEAIINSLLSPVADGLANIINIGLGEKAASDGITPKQEFIDTNATFVHTEGTPSLDFDSMMIALGNVAPVEADAPDFSTAAKVSVTITEDYYEEGYSHEEDIVHCVVYNPAVNLYFEARANRRASISTPLVVSVPSFWSGNNVYVYVFVQDSVDNTKCSDSICIGNGRIR